MDANLIQTYGDKMIDAEEALGVVLKNTRRLAGRKVPLLDSCGLILAEKVKATGDNPPFNSSAMDGYAIIASDTKKVPAQLQVIEEIPAGKWPRKKVSPGKAARIMTGAPVPQGADTVIMVEDTEPALPGQAGCGRVRILSKIAPRQNIRYQGENIKKGELLLEPGTLLGPAEVGLLASAGKAEVKVTPPARVAILATGDEVVEPGKKPKPWEIRNSNSYTLAAQVTECGADYHYLGIVPDNKQRIRRAIRQGLKSDCLIISGGVSVGEYDLVTDILQQMGVKIHFDSVKIKPGKPTVFGTYKRTPVFGLPGNPVSSLVTFELFVRPALAKMMGKDEAARMDWGWAYLAERFELKRKRRQFIPAISRKQKGRLWVKRVKYHGSADLVALRDADYLIEIPPDAPPLSKGKRVRILRLLGRPSNSSLETEE